MRGLNLWAYTWYRPSILEKLWKHATNPSEACKISTEQMFIDFTHSGEYITYIIALTLRQTANFNSFEKFCSASCFNKVLFN